MPVSLPVYSSSPVPVLLIFYVPHPPFSFSSLVHGSLFTPLPSRFLLSPLCLGHLTVFTTLLPPLPPPPRSYGWPFPPQGISFFFASLPVPLLFHGSLMVVISTLLKPLLVALSPFLLRLHPLAFHLDTLYYNPHSFLTHTYSLLFPR